MTPKSLIPPWYTRTLTPETSLPEYWNAGEYKKVIKYLVFSQCERDLNLGKETWVIDEI